MAKQASANTMTVAMTVEKETKGAVRYQEDKANELDEAKIGTLYVRKSAFAQSGAIPHNIAVQVSW